MTYDLIIIAASKNAELVRMTQTAIDSCLADKVDVNVILVETFREASYKHVDKLLMYEGQFNYNRALNMGLKEAKGDIHILANNDIIFKKGWSIIGEIMALNDILSASALSNAHTHRGFKPGNHAYEGYLIGYHITGWCLFVHKDVFAKIGKLSEAYTFWYSDNAYAEQIAKAKIKHALICSVHVDHLTSRTLVTEDIKKRHELTHAEGKRFLKSHTKNL